MQTNINIKITKKMKINRKTKTQIKIKMKIRMKIKINMPIKRTIKIKIKIRIKIMPKNITRTNLPQNSFLGDHLLLVRQRQHIQTLIRAEFPLAAQTQLTKL